MSCACELCCIGTVSGENSSLGGRGLDPDLAARQPSKPGVRVEEPNKGPTLGTKGLQRVLGLSDVVNVYVLNEIKVGGRTVRQIDVYSSLDGNHIRTIPHTRFSNPQSVAAGYGYLAVVDKFNNQELIRITDTFGGAPSDAFDSNGDPDDRDWSSIEDICVIPTLADSAQFFSGIHITPDGFLLAAVNGDVVTVDATTKTVTDFLVVDIVDLQNKGIRRLNSVVYCTGTSYQVFRPVCKSLITLAPPFDEIGNVVGAPVPFNDNINPDKFKMFVITDTNLILIIDHFNSRVLGTFAIPNEAVPIGITHTSNILSIQTRDSSTGQVVVYRTIITEDTVSLIGDAQRVSGIPLPSQGNITRTFEPLDALSSVGNKEQLLQYAITTVAATSNESQKDALLADYTSKVNALLTDFRSARTGSQSDFTYGRTVTYGTFNVNNSYYKYSFFAQIIRTPLPPAGTTIELRGVSCAYGVVGELYSYKEDDVINPTKPTLLLLHGTHYDYLSDGGYSYGCQGATQSTGLTNGALGISIAIARDIEGGVLKDLPDTKLLLIDSDNGRILYHYPKPLGVNYYGATYAALQLVQGADKSDCTAIVEGVAESLDGISRETGTKSPVHPAPFANDLNFDAIFAIMRRRTLNNKNIVAKLTEKSWSSTEDDGFKLEDWVGQSNPGKASYTTSIFRYPTYFGKRDIGETTASLNSGFFPLGLKKEPSSLRRELLLDISELETQKRSAPPEQQESIQAQIDAKQEQIDEGDESLDDVIYRTPRNILNIRYSGLDVSAPQLLDPVEGGTNESIGAIGGLTPYTVTTVEGLPYNAVGNNPVPLRRGCVVKPGIRTWVGVTVNFERWEQMDFGGVGTYVHPQTRENGLGIRLEDYPTAISEGFRITGSSIYESGWTCTDYVGRWEYEILLDGAKAEKVATKVALMDEIFNLAPIEAAGGLVGTFMTKGGDGEFKLIKGKVFYTEKNVEVVTIKAKLMNICQYVYPYGYKTIRRIDGQNRNDGFYTCWQTDPGFYADNTCESLGCGNVPCSSFIFHGKKNRKKDPIYLWTKQIVWEQEATFSMPNNPYKEKGISVGKVMDINFAYKLNRPMNNYIVDIRDGKGPEAPGSRQ